MDKHTPGPWFVDEHGNISAQDKYSDYELLVARVRGENEPEPTGTYAERIKANRRLISAAPDLLDALEKILNYPYPEYDNYTLGKARDAIAKARGE